MRNFLLSEILKSGAVSEAWPGPPQVSKIENFAIIVNSYYAFAIVAKLSILDDCGGLCYVPEYQKLMRKCQWISEIIYFSKYVTIFACGNFERTYWFQTRKPIKSVFFAKIIDKVIAVNLVEFSCNLAIIILNFLELIYLTFTASHH